MQLVYGQTVSNQASALSDSSESEGSDDEDFFKPKGQADKVCPFIQYQIYSYEDLIANQPFCENTCSKMANT